MGAVILTNQASWLVRSRLAARSLRLSHRAYVALSRCRTPEGMRVEGFSPAVVMAHRNVIEFYKRLKQGKPL